MSKGGLVPTIPAMPSLPLEPILQMTGCSPLAGLLRMSLSVWSARSRDSAGKQQMVVAWSDGNRKPHGNAGGGTNLKNPVILRSFFHGIFPGLPV